MKKFLAVAFVDRAARRLVRSCFVVAVCVVLLTLGCDEGGGHPKAAARTGTAPTPAAASPLSFAGPKTYPTGAEPQSAAIGDLNGDGKPDLMTPNRDAASVSLLINRGRGNFHSERRFRVGNEPSSVALGDLDGDRNLDVVTANGDASTISVLLNSGHGTFERKRDYRTGYDPNSVALGDLNGDGDLDVVTANFGDGTVSAFLNTGDGTFEGKSVYRTQVTLVSVAVADLDGDGKADLVLTPADKVIVLLNKGDGTFSDKDDYETGAYPVVAIGDLNGDGKPDVATSTDESLASVLVNEGDGSFRGGGDYVTGRSNRSATMCERCVAIGDLNGDGKPDIVTANQGSDSVSVLLNRGDGSFRPRRDYRTGTEPRSIAIDDLNGDGQRDLVSAAAGNMVVILINTAGATTAPARRARPARPRGTVVFASNRSGNFEIYSVHADGSQLGQLTRSGGRAPIFSPDGRRLARLVDDEASTDSLWVANADRSGERKLASYVHDPVWAPDGSRIAYTDLDGRLVISSVDGSRRVVFRGPVPVSAGPSWSPDGRRLVFLRGIDRRDLAIVGDDGGGLTTIRRGIGGRPVWSPRGDLIAVPARDGALAVVTPQGRGVRRVAWKADAFAWSPDGRRIAFVAGGRLYVVRADAGSPRDITPASPGRLDAPAWSPDGRWLAMTSLAPGALFHDLLVAAANGSSSRRITTRIPKPYGSESLSPTWWPREATRGRLGGAPVAPLPSEVVSASAYDTAGSMSSLAADGARAIVVFYPRIGSCASIAVWEPRRRRVVRLQRPCLPGEESMREGTGAAALAGARAAWLRTAGGNTLEQYLYTATLARRTPVEIAEAYAEEGAYGDFIRDPVAHGSLLVFTRERRCAQFPEGEDRCPPGRKPQDVVAAGIWRVADDGRHVVRVAGAKGKLTALAVAGGRIAAETDHGVRLLTEDGHVIRDFDVAARQAALSEKWLALRTADAVEVYDIESGRRAHRFPAAKHLRLEDLEGDILVTASGREVTLRRLSDGRTTTIHTRGLASAQLEPPGLFVAGTRRVTFTPMSDVLRRFRAASPGR